MEGTTEPIIVVIGHPIAGNPSQFAIERALHAMKLDWRVLSFDVLPQDVGAALGGFAVTGIVGVLLDPSVASAASDWFRQRSALTHVPSDDSNPDHESHEVKEVESEPVTFVVDCLYRNDQDQLVASHQSRAWVDEQVGPQDREHCIWFGDDLTRYPISPQTLNEVATETPPSLEQIKEASVIVITDGEQGPLDLEIEDWPHDDGKTLVINFSDSPMIDSKLRGLDYRVVSADDIRIGTLVRCLRQWTGRTPPTDVIRDAIEEYLGV
jgi:hypothetical protein